MRNKIRKMILAGIVIFSLLTSAGYAAPAWQLPDAGKIFDNAAKQDYIADRMSKFFSGQLKATFAVPDKWTHEKFSINGVQVERLANLKHKKSAREVLQLHGGGYIDGLTDLHRELAVKQAVLTEAREVYMVDYRLAPDNLYPSALEDAAQVYEELLSRGVEPKNLIVFGDSAGGNLALELALYLKENNLPQPALLILNSPWTTFETDFPSREGNSERDLVLGKINGYMYREVQNPSYGGALPLKDPRLSPIYADLKNLPPMLIQIGGYEMFVDEGIELLRKATADELNVTLSVYQGMPHDFSILLPELDESVKSFAEVKNFVSTHITPRK